MFLSQRSTQPVVGAWLCLLNGLAACSLQMPSESDVFGSAGAQSAAGSAGSVMPSSSAGAGGTSAPQGSGGNKGPGGATGSAGAGGSAEFDPTAGLVAYFKFDEGSGATAANSKDSTKNAKCVGSCARSNGQLGGAFGLRNSVSATDWIELPTGIFDGRSAITLSVWLRDLSSTRNEAPLFHFSTSADEAFYLLPDDDQRSAMGAHLVGVHSGTSFVNLSSATPNLTDKVWHQVVIAWNSSKIELYLDGNSVGSAANPKVLPSQLGASSTNYLGRSRNDDRSALFGEVDDLRIYDRVLSAADVKLLYKVR
jgi:hypothetical protein